MKPELLEGSQVFIRSINGLSAWRRRAGPSTLPRRPEKAALLPRARLHEPPAQLVCGAHSLPRGVWPPPLPFNVREQLCVESPRIIFGKRPFHWRASGGRIKTPQEAVSSIRSWNIGPPAALVWAVAPSPLPYPSQSPPVQTLKPRPLCFPGARGEQECHQLARILHRSAQFNGGCKS